MWTDNETTDDLLGFRVHCDLIKSVVTDEDLLPVVMGVFGDWGGGKSSIMRMLEQDLEKEEGIVCLYFNGWVFEGYEDAKTALLTSILVAIGEHQRFDAKLKEKAGRLLRRVKWMDLGRVAAQNLAIPIGAAALTGGVGAIPIVLGGMAAAAASGLKPGQAKEGESKPFWDAYLEEEKTQPDILEVRKFREEFENLLSETDINSLVILIDDLDRCLPPRIIDTLEAIKLFVAVPKTAFVIGADEFIVRHAISTRYVNQQLDEKADIQEERNLTTDYLEKLVQIPYHLPRLSPSEMETYINLLLCQKFLKDEAQKQSVLTAWKEQRASDFYTTFNYGAVKAVLGEDKLPEVLTQNLVWSSGVAVALTEGLKGNPRQVKRMLNAMRLRTTLAGVAKLPIKAEILAKLMVLEYTNPKLFRQLDNWQTVGKGFAGELKQLEAPDAEVEGEEAKEKLEVLPDWSKPAAKRWLQMEPNLGELDLRNYFWIARDRTKSTLSSASLSSPKVTAIYQQLVDGNEGEQIAAINEATALDALQMESLISQLAERIHRHPDETPAAEALVSLAEKEMAGAGESLIETISQVSPSALSPVTANMMGNFAQSYPALKEKSVKLLQELAGSPNTAAGKAAEIALKDIIN